MIITGSGCREKCPDSRIKKMMGSLYRKNILFPEKVELLNGNGGDSASQTRIDASEPVFYIVHFFMSDCDKCVNELRTIQRFMKKHSDISGVKYIFITSGPTKKYAKEAIEKSGFDQPVYYETEYFSFKKLNNLPLADRLYNTMLIQNKQVILFGEVFQNEKAEEFFFDAIKGCNRL